MENHARNFLSLPYYSTSFLNEPPASIPSYELLDDSERYRALRPQRTPNYSQNYVDYSQFPMYSFLSTKKTKQENLSHPIKSPRECKFCRNNGETAQHYKSHTLRNPTTGVLICPVLREHVCEICHSTGDDAHTRNYCPMLKKANLQRQLALPMELKKTKRQSDGTFRTNFM